MAEIEKQAQQDSPTEAEPGPLSFRQTLGSVLAAAFGVQSQKNRERDFARGSAGQFILVGGIATVIFVLLVLLVVNLVLS